MLFRSTFRRINRKQAIIATASFCDRRAVILATQQAFASREAGIAHYRQLRSPGAQALSCARPFARRALITARPARVFIRALKPCRRFRLTSLGWKVRFIRRISNTVAGSQKGVGVYSLLWRNVNFFRGSRVGCG